MASSEQQVPPRTPAADIVGNAFVDQYYHMLHESPELVHKFYQEVSKLGRPEQNGLMGITTTLTDINKKILSLGYGELSAEIISVDAQESYGGGVLVLVTGFMTGEDDIKQKFTQCFFLAPQEKGYFVLNDVFRYVNENGFEGSARDIGSPVSHDNVADPAVLETQVSEQISVTAEEGEGEEVYNPENGQASVEEEEEAPVPEVVDEIPDDSQVVAGLTSQIEDVPKKSYASIVKVTKESPAQSSTAAVVSVKYVVKSQDRQGTAAPPPPNTSETNVSSINTNDIGNNQETEAEGYSIYVKGLSPNATPALVENEFKKFGPIKSGGVQVRTQKGFSFGFVEFAVASAMQSALEASPILINGRHVVVEEKRSVNRGNSRIRFPTGRAPGYRGEGARGRGGNYGNGRGYGRGGDSNGRGDYGYRNGNRGGFSSRGDGGYQRSDNTGASGGGRNDHTGASGGRMNRTGGSAVNAAPKTTAVRVPASA
ncbi:putative RNA recognition motif domain, nuclear transport factor 2, NTF2-like protein [Lupinus albus]|uniref:Putative RNA recognition motif domain, nuclear transport factor 2, NTF2-like protein n=1 Tax=Lupinus albus TaxID=3870 RepID=A0A6A4NRP5_LUPAL|nr:putative RNA recognition motif domain, nuclear transport factor 2, NTF2-like protein [Lupinus albus]